MYCIALQTMYNKTSGTPYEHNTRWWYTRQWHIVALTTVVLAAFASQQHLQAISEHDCSRRQVSHTHTSCQHSLERGRERKRESTIRKYNFLHDLYLIGLHCSFSTVGALWLSTYASPTFMEEILGMTCKRHYSYKVEGDSLKNGISPGWAWFCGT